MLKISSRQIELLGNNGLENFLKRLWEHLQHSPLLPSHKKNLTQSEVRMVSEEAQRLGFRTEWEIASIVEIVVFFSVDLKAEKITAITDDKLIHPIDKVLLLQELA